MDKPIDNQVNVELQFELKKLEFTPYGKQYVKCVELIDKLDIFSLDFKQTMAQFRKENALFC